MKKGITIAALIFLFILSGATHFNKNTAFNTVITVHAAENIIGTGTVTGDGVNVREGPSTQSAKIGSLSGGVTVNVLGEENGWYKIEFNGKTGYVFSDYLNFSKKDAAADVHEAGNEETDEEEIAIGPIQGLLKNTMAVVLIIIAAAVLLLIIIFATIASIKRIDYEDDDYDDYEDDNYEDYDNDDDYEDEDYDEESYYEADDYDEAEDYHRAVDYAKKKHRKPAKSKQPPVKKVKPSVSNIGKGAAHERLSPETVDRAAYERMSLEEIDRAAYERMSLEEIDRAAYERLSPNGAGRAVYERLSPEAGRGADSVRFMSNNPEDYRIDIDPKFFETSTLPVIEEHDVTGSSTKAEFSQGKDEGSALSEDFVSNVNVKSSKEDDIAKAMKKMEELQKEIERIKNSK